MDWDQISFVGDGCEVRFDADKRTLSGYGAVYNRWSQRMGTFREIIRPGAFDDVLRAVQAGQADVVATYEHGGILGRTSSGTLQIRSDERGLWYDIQLPDTQLGRDVQQLVARGDVKGSSFGFRADQQRVKWGRDTEGETREINRVERLRDIGPVINPAYTASPVTLRSLEQFQAESARNEPYRVERLRLRLQQLKL